MGRAARRGKTGFTGQILQTWRAVYACLPRPPTAQASINAAAVPRVATASGDRALEKSYKPKKLLSLHRKKRCPSTRPPATRATAPAPRTDRRTAATAASTPTPARSRRPVCRTTPPAGDGRGRRLHWSLRAHHIFHGSVQREMYLSGHGSRQARREAARKNNNVQAVLRQEKHKQLQDTFD